MAGKSSHRSARMSGPVDPSQRIVDAALKLAAQRSWGGIGLDDIAAEAGMSLAELYRIHRSKGAILAAFRRRIDESVLAGLDRTDRDENPRDRLFDALMRRFDALKPYRAGIAMMWREGRHDPLAALAGICGLSQSMAWMLEASGISAAGLLGRLRCKGLTAIWLATLPTWIADDSDDLATTMAALDRLLKRADGIIATLSRGPFGGPSASQSGL